jgi:hypothetical protein
VDPAHPDLTRFPLFRQAHPFTTILKPGDLMYLPPDWWHYTTCLDDSIGVSFSFINRTNAGEYFKTLGGRLPFICRDLETESFNESAPVQADGALAAGAGLFGDYALRTLENAEDEEVIAKILAHFPADAVRREHFLFSLSRDEGDRCARILDRILRVARTARVQRDAAFHLAALALLSSRQAESLLLQHSREEVERPMRPILRELASAVSRKRTTLVDLCRLYLQHRS